MDASAMILRDSGIWLCNRSALFRVDPKLGQSLNDAGDLDDHVELAVTRDNQRNYRIRRPDGSWEWFGRTSIPSVRAESVLDRFDSGPANVLLPGIGEGSEAELLLRRFGPHRAVFVWEPDIAAIRLVLELHDFAQDIEGGRFIPIWCGPESLTARLVGWLEQHPGHLCPQRILMWPWQKPADIASCRTAVELAYQRIEASRRAAQAACHSRLAVGERQVPGSVVRPAARVAILSLHANAMTGSVVDALSVGIEAAGGEAVLADVRGPGDMHPLARIRKLADQPPDWAILIDVTREQVRDVLPQRVPAITWLGLRSWPTRELVRQAAGDTLLMTSEPDSDLDVQVEICPPPCLATEYPEPGDEARSWDAVIFADRGPVDPGGMRPGLPTYAAVWDQAVAILKDEIDTFTDNRVESVLARAERRTGHTVEDGATRSELAGALVQVVALSLVTQDLVQRLISQDVRFVIAGPGWEAVAGDRAIGPSAGAAARLALLRRAKTLLHVDPSGRQVHDPLLAATAGAVVIARGHPRHDRPGGLGTLLKAGQEYVTARGNREILARTRGLLGHENQRIELARQAHITCRAAHHPRVRFEALAAAATSLFSSGRG